MQVAHQRLQPFLQHMGIDLRGGDVGVAEQSLHHAQVGAVVQQVAGEGMAQHMRAESRAGAMPQAAPSAFSSRAKCWRVRWPCSPNEGNSHFDCASRASPRSLR